MPTYLYGQLTQRLPKILEPRYEALRFENGDLIPTKTDLIPGAKEIAYERLSEFGDADLLADAGTNIPIVDISVDEDRYPVVMVGSGFPVSFQEERAMSAPTRGRLGYATSNLDRFDRRMALGRKVIAQRRNRIIAYGKVNLGFPGFMNNPLVNPVQVANVAAGKTVNTATYTELCDFFVAQIETITDNFVSNEATEMLVSASINRRLGVQNVNGTKSVRGFLEEEYPGITITKIRESQGSELLANGVSIPAGYDRIVLYPNTEEVVHQHIENEIAQLVPEEYIRIDGLRKIYTLFSCFTPAIIDLPQDFRYVDVQI